MRSSFMIFLLGVILGSTLGIGGIWTQVVKPAAEEFQELEEENGVMKTALDEAGTALQQVAKTLRESAGSSGPMPLKSSEVIPLPSLPGSINPVTPETKTEVQPRVAPARDTNELANQLDTLAERLAKTRGERTTRRFNE